MPVTPPEPVAGAPALELRSVGRVFDGRTVLHDVDLRVEAGQRWIVLGPNGSGKSTLLQIAALLLHPTVGTVRVLGHELGRVDVRGLRRHVGVAAPGLADQLRPALTTTDVVMTAKNAALEPWWHTYDDGDRARARELLAVVGCTHLAAQSFGQCSSGERQRVLLARALMSAPGILLLDEPNAALDLAGREELVRALTGIGGTDGPPSILVTHHVEEIPDNITDVLLLREGRVLATGPPADTLTGEALSECFGLTLRVERRHDRWTAWAPR